MPQNIIAYRGDFLNWQNRYTIILQHQAASKDEATDVPCQYHFCTCLLDSGISLVISLAESRRCSMSYNFQIFLIKSVNFVTYNIQNFKTLLSIHL